jgi:hypothetical protein
MTDFGAAGKCREGDEGIMADCAKHAAVRLAAPAGRNEAVEDT